MMRPSPKPHPMITTPSRALPRILATGIAVLLTVRACAVTDT